LNLKVCNICKHANDSSSLSVLQENEIQSLCTFYAISDAQKAQRVAKIESIHVKKHHKPVGEPKEFKKKTAAIIPPSQLIFPSQVKVNGRYS
jgi:hypothetical protein